MTSSIPIPKQQYASDFCTDPATKQSDTPFVEHNFDTPAMILEPKRSRELFADPFLIGVAGGTASGKTTVCDSIMQELHDQCIALISEESFYTILRQQKGAVDVEGYNFDHPDSIDVNSLVETLNELKAGKKVELPVYNNGAAPTTRLVESADVIMVEGLLVLHHERVRQLLDMAVFVDVTDDTRLARRIIRDVQEKGLGVDKVLERYTHFVKPGFEAFVAPSKRFADVVIPWESSNPTAIKLIAEHIRTKLRRPQLLKSCPNLQLVPSNYQIRGMHTIIRNKDTPKPDFEFFADRLSRVVVETGLGQLPYVSTPVVTNAGHIYQGIEFSNKICGVAIVPGGESMEAALRACCLGIKIGKVLVAREDKSDHRLLYHKLPADIAGRIVLMLDPVLATGGSACAAIKVVLDQGVPQANILFLTLIAAPEGIRAVCSAFPDVKLLVSELDTGLDQNRAVVPGVGDFSYRYFLA